jgi:hypothetical protein
MVSWPHQRLWYAVKRETHIHTLSHTHIHNINTHPHAHAHTHTYTHTECTVASGELASSMAVVCG